MPRKWLVMRGEWLVHVIGHFEIEHELLEIDLDH